MWESAVYTGVCVSNVLIKIFWRSSAGREKNVVLGFGFGAVRMAGMVSGNFAANMLGSPAKLERADIGWKNIGEGPRETKTAFQNAATSRGGSVFKAAKSSSPAIESGGGVGMVISVFVLGIRAALEALAFLEVRSVVEVLDIFEETIIAILVLVSGKQLLVEGLRVVLTFVVGVVDRVRVQSL